MRGFLIHSVDDGRVPAFEHLPASAIKPEIGMALVMAGGVLVQAVGTAVPAYISMCQKETACEEGDSIPVIRVQPDIIFSTEHYSDVSDINIGDKIGITNDGMQTITDEGNAEVVGIGEGNTVLVRFA